MGQTKQKIICDIDGILCENTRVPYLIKRPHIKNINIINKLYESGFKIIIFTSRKKMYRKQTIRWLKTFNIKYDNLIMGKPKGDYYCDDKSITLKQLSKLTGG